MWATGSREESKCVQLCRVLGPRHAEVNDISKTGCSRARLHTITSESLTLPLLNNLPVYRQNGPIGSPNIIGMLSLPTKGEHWVLDTCQSREKHQLEWRQKAAPWKSVSEKQRHLLNPGFPRQGSMRVRLPPRRGKAREWKHMDSSVLEVWGKYYQCHNLPQ